MSTDEWNTFFHDKKESDHITAISTARDSYLAQREWWNKISRTLPKDQTERVVAVVEKYEHEHSMLALEKLVEGFLADFQERKSQLERQRSRGGRKFSHGAQAFLNNFSEFLTCYSDVVNIVKSADSQFGGVAVQALSIFLIVAVNKQQREDLIVSSLETMKSQFPRLKGWGNIYPTEKMQQLIVAVYMDVIEFAREAVSYYKRSTWARVWYAIISPPQRKLQAKVDLILRELSEVKEETNFLLSQRVGKIERDLGKANEALNDMQRQKQKNRELFNSFQEAMLPGGYSKSEQLETCKTQLQHRFTRREVSLFSLSDLKKDSRYETWFQSTIAQTLVIRGSTSRGLRTPLSWLSNAAIELIEKLESENAVVAYYFCCLEADGTSQKLGMADILCKVIYQLFEAKPDLLQDEELEQNYLVPIRNRTWDNKYVCELLVNIVKRIGIVYLVLDRPEDCKGGIRVLSRLFEKAKEAGCILKTMIVFDRDRTDFSQVEELQDAEGFSYIDDLNQC
ncbi:uncharacterized protein K452DRAFT_16706 [Aplosporella prunicola CBS 121167]|uniref:Fungal STAND N-terminal Goodbye domain-containing protein n=1 Tax=Aplosporella prunicola CBS 121167 TaxID=1176127 RepID=A0A6A6BDL0_9PEZI|nr:uncharacterized protein K452DRAFT_16706 [Aplosporella prunicola CBS 121167]KAF2142279.1 hypothetical protein K452DRAFT_16706 [Aplosporella prunicola CBS 121167]